MSTKNYINTFGNKVKRNLNNKALIPTKGTGLHQEFLASHFKNTTTAPGGKNDCEIDLTQTYDIENEKLWLIRLKVNTSDATNHLTLYSDIYNLIKSIELRLNDSREVWKYEENYMIRLLRSEALKEYGDRLTEKRAESDNQFNAITGVQITNVSSQYFYINLFDLFPHFRNTSVNGLISNIKCQVEFMPVPASAQDGGYIGASNTTANAYNSSVTFTDMDFIRVYEVITDTKMLSRPPLDLVVIDQPYFENKQIDMAWNATTDQYKFNVNDLFKLKNFKKILAYVTVDASAYNTATNGMWYSGHNYIYWKVEEKSGGSNRKTLDFTTATPDNVKRLRAYEIERHRKTYGNDLPIAIHANSDNYNKYFLLMTEIYFDEIDNSEITHETFPDYDSTQRDYVVTLTGGTTGLGANCQLNIVAVSNEFFRFNPKTLKIEGIERLE